MALLILLYQFEESIEEPDLHSSMEAQMSAASQQALHARLEKLLDGKMGLENFMIDGVLRESYEHGDLVLSATVDGLPGKAVIVLKSHEVLLQQQHLESILHTTTKLSVSSHNDMYNPSPSSHTSQHHTN